MLSTLGFSGSFLCLNLHYIYWWLIFHIMLRLQFPPTGKHNTKSVSNSAQLIISIAAKMKDEGNAGCPILKWGSQDTVSWEGSFPGFLEFWVNTCKHCFTPNTVWLLHNYREIQMKAGVLGGMAPGARLMLDFICHLERELMSPLPLTSDVCNELKP